MIQQPKGMREVEAILGVIDSQSLRSWRHRDIRETSCLPIPLELVPGKLSSRPGIGTELLAKCGLVPLPGQDMFASSSILTRCFNGSTQRFLPLVLDHGGAL